MAVSRVILSPDVYLTCLSHALSSETEEIMGVVIGHHDNKERVCHVRAVFMLARSDKRPDRVEIPYVQLTNASEYAEKLSAIHEQQMNVVGWYHSHPHITVWPSNVDLRTQAGYQLLDQRFVGIIFSCFAEGKDETYYKTEHIAFQSIDQNADGEPPSYSRVCIPMYVEGEMAMSPECVAAFVKIPSVFEQEEQEEYDKVQSGAESLYISLHNQFVYGSKLLALMENVSSSVIQCLEDTLRNKKKQVEYYRHLLDKRPAPAAAAPAPTSPTY